MKKFAILVLLALALFVFGCSSDQSSSPTATALHNVRTDPGTGDSPSSATGEGEVSAPLASELDEVGFAALFDVEKAFPPCITFVDVWGYVWTLNISGGVITGTVDTGPCGIYQVSGSGSTINAYGTNPDCCDFTYYVTAVDRPNRYAEGRWTNVCGGSGTWSGTGGPCK